MRSSKRLDDQKLKEVRILAPHIIYNGKEENYKDLFIGSNQRTRLCRSILHFADAEHKVKDYCEKKYPNNIIEVVNPMSMPKVQIEWADFILRDLFFLRHCDYIYMMDGWEYSYGARVEYNFAKGAGIKILDI